MTALLLAGEPLRVREAELMNDAMAVLLDAGLQPGSTHVPDTEEDL